MGTDQLAKLAGEDYRVPQKKWDLFLISIFIKLNANLPGIYFIRKVGSINLSAVQKHFCMILGKRDISQSEWDIKSTKL